MSYGMVALVTYTSYGVALFFFLFWCGMWVVHILGLVYGRYRLHRKVILSSETPLPGVSILKPLVGVDPNLFANLETFFTMQYPLYELLFCIHDEHDPSLMLVRRLMEKYPSVDARIFIGGEKVGENPKINNMQPGYNAAKYQLVMVSDSGLRMKEDALLDMANHMTDKVGLVHQMPFVCDRPRFPSVLEKVYFGTSHARIYLTADLVRINCATGMSAMMRKSLLDSQGGIRAFGNYLAEDYFFAKAILDQGYRITISSQPACQNSGHYDIQTFRTRIMRWAKLRTAMLPSTIVFEPFSECMLLGLCNAWSTYFLFSWDPIVFYLLHILVWLLLDYTLLTIVQNGSPNFNKFEFLVAWIFRELNAPVVFFHALWEPAIKWRTGEFRLRWGGAVEEIKPKVKL